MGDKWWPEEEVVEMVGFNSHLRSSLSLHFLVTKERPRKELPSIVDRPQTGLHQELSHSGQGLQLTYTFPFVIWEVDSFQLPRVFVSPGICE